VNLGRIGLNRFVELVSTTPGKLFGLYPRKGTLAAGSDADIVMWDPEAEHVISSTTHHMRVDYSMFEGFKVKGNAKLVMSRGDVLVEEGRWLGKAGRGRFLKRAARGGAWN
jgi:dihydropyrimidinase